MAQWRYAAFAVFSVVYLPDVALGQLRIATWNVTSYSGGRDGPIATAVYGSFEGRSMAPDVLVVQEIVGGGAEALATILNDAPDSPGDWRAAPGAGTAGDGAVLYRTTRMAFLEVTLVAAGGASPRPPRDIVRWDLRLVGYQADAATVAIYNTHMKAGTGADDQLRRLVEARAIRDNAETLPDGWTFLLAGDLNIQNSTEDAYVELTGPQADDRGRLFDPIAAPGRWHEQQDFRFLHTQDPIGAGGMDDRFDQILLSADLFDGAGLDYLGNPAEPYSGLTWDDPNHSYRAWGNDGSSFNQSLRTTGNTMVGPAIASALRQAVAPAGHLPVFLDMQVPARLNTVASIDFGAVEVGQRTERTLFVGNAGEIDRWGAAIEDLTYRLESEAPFAAPAGEFRDAAGGAINAHTIALDTSRPGRFEVELLLTSNAPDDPARRILLTATVEGDCRADLTGDGVLDVFDFLEFQNLFARGDPRADFTGDGALDLFDFLQFQNEFATGC
ncbi:MAG: GC-type dockerin domain-anchored protein [Phycisphaerales bacterium JB039]